MNQELKQIQKQEELLSQAEYPQLTEIAFPYSIKIEQSAKGSRVSVHVYGKTQESAIKEAIETYVNTRKELLESGCPLAPEE